MTRPTGTTVRLLFVATVLAAIVAIGMAGLAAGAGAAGDASAESTTNHEQVNPHWDWKDDGEIKEASAVALLNDLKGDGAMLVQAKYKTSPKTDVTITVTGADGKERTIERRGLGFTQRSYIFLGVFDGAKYPVEVTISTPEETVSGTLTERKERVQLVEEEPPEPVDLDLSLEDDELEVGESTEATVMATFDDESTADVTDDAVIESNDTSVASVDDSTITAEGPGTAEISAEYEGLTDTATLDVREPVVEEAFFAVDITATNSPVQEGETLTVDATVTNIGDVADTQTVTLDINDMEVDSDEVSLEGGEGTAVQLTWETEENDAGEYDATVASANDSDTVGVEVQPDVEAPDSFEAYVAGEQGYLHTGTDENPEPIEFTVCEDFEPTDEYLDDHPNYLPEPECIEAHGEIDDVTNTWDGDFEFPTTVMEEEDDILGDVYVEADIETDEDGASGTWDHATGEIDAEFTVNIDVAIYDVEEHGVPFDQVGDDERITEPECHVPDVTLDPSTEKSFEANSPFPDEDVVSGERLTDDEALLVSADFPVDGAEDCGDVAGIVDLNDAINDELGLPAEPGESELAFDLNFEFEVEPEPFFDVEILETNSPVEEGETLEVETEIENTGDEAGTQDVVLDIDGDEVDSTSVSLDPDESATETLSWETDEDDAGDYTATASSEDDSDSVDVSVLEPDQPAFFDVDITETNSPIDEGETLAVDATIENTGDLADTQDVTLDIDGDDVDSAEVSLDGTESANVTLEWATEVEDAGDYTATVSSANDTDSVDVTVDPLDAAFFAVEITDTNSPVVAGDTLTVDAEIENTGDLADTQDVTLDIDGDEVDSVEVSLDGTESADVTLEWETTEEDVTEHTATVSSQDDSDSVEVTIDPEPEPFFDVQITETNSPIDEGETLAVDATIENTGDLDDTQDVTLDIDGDEVATESVSLEAGESTDVSLEWATEIEDAGDYTATVSSADDSDTVEVTVNPLDEAFFAVEITDTNSPVVAGDTLSVDAEIENTGDLADTQDVTLDIDGDEVDSTEVSLDGTESADVTLEWETTEDDVTEHTATVSSQDDSDSVEVTVDPEPEPFFDVEITDTNAPIDEGDTLAVDATIENTGDLEDTQDVDLDIDGDVVDTESVSLDPGDTAEVTLEWATEVEDAGDYTATVSSADDSDSVEVTVDPLDPAFFAVNITDTNSPVVAGDTLAVDATIANTGDLADTQDVTLDIGGDDVDSTEVSLEGDESADVTLGWETTEDDVSEHTATVSSQDDSDSVEVTVDPEPEPFFDVEITDTNAPIDEGETLAVDADIENTGDLEDTQDVELDIDGEVVDTEAISLEAGDTAEVTLEWETEIEQAGTYTATVSSADDSDTVEVTVEPAVEVPDNFTAYVAGERGYLQTGTGADEVPDPIEFTECEDFEPTQEAIDDEPDYLPEPECIEAHGDIDAQNNTWEGDFDFPTTIMEEEDDLAGELYVEANIDTDEDGAFGTWDHQSGLLTFETEVSISVNLYQVEHGTDWDDVTEEDRITDDTCHIPEVALEASTEKSYETESTFPDTDVVAGERLEDNEAFLVANDFPVGGAQECGTLGDFIELNPIINDELGVPADEGENEVAFDPVFEFDAPAPDPEPNFQIDSLETNDPIDAGETLTVEATVENTGGDGTQTVSLSIDDDPVDSAEVELPAGASEVITLEWATSEDDEGTYTATVSTDDDSASVDVTVDAVEVGPSSFDAYVAGERGYLQTGTGAEEVPDPIEFTECENFEPTQQAIDDEPDYLPDPECIEAHGTIDHEDNTWEGDFDFPTTIMEEEDDLAGELYVEANIDTDEDGAFGTWDHEAGLLTFETTVSISVNLYQVEHGTDWDDVTEEDRITDDTCHIPEVALEASTEKSYESQSDFTDQGFVEGERLEDDEAFLAANDFPVGGAQECGTLGDFIDLNPIINDELGVPADEGENEVAFDPVFDFEE